MSVLEYPGQILAAWLFTFKSRYLRSNHWFQDFHSGIHHAELRDVRRRTIPTDTAYDQRRRTLTDAWPWWESRVVIIKMSFVSEIDVSCLEQLAWILGFSVQLSNRGWRPAHAVQTKTTWRISLTESGEIVIKRSEKLAFWNNFSVWKAD